MCLDKNGVLVATLGFIIFFIMIANGVNLYDFFTYKNMIETSGKFDLVNTISTAFGPWGGGSGLSRSSLYVLVSYPAAYIVGKDFAGVDLVLNLLSAIFVSISVYFVYITSSLFFNKKLSFVSSVVYMALPWIFFNGINATISSMQLMFSSVWIYFITIFYKKGGRKASLLAAGALTANAFVYLSSVFLIPSHLYVLYKKRSAFRQMANNLAILSPAALLFLYFLLFNPAYPVSKNAGSFIFSAALMSWESVNALSLPVIILLVMGVVRGLRKFNAPSPVYEIFLISFTALLPSLLIFHYVPVSNFNTLFVVIPILSLYHIKNTKKLFLILFVVLFFAAIKTVPMAVDFHSFSHPHRDYAVWLSEIVGSGDKVLVGHECAAARVYLPDRTICENEEKTLNNTGRIFVTSEYIENENQKELAYAVSMLGLDTSQLNLGGPEFIKGKNLTLYKTFAGGVRPVEDHYQFLYSVYPSILNNLFFYSALPTSPYSLYILEKPATG